MYGAHLSLVASLLVHARWVPIVFADEGVIVLTADSGQSDGHQRFIQSANHIDISVNRFVGPGDRCQSCMNTSPLKKYQAMLQLELSQPRKLVLITDSRTAVIHSNNSNQILQAFRSLNARIVFAASDHCLTSDPPASKYPDLMGGYRYLNAAGIIGFATDLYQLFQVTDFRESKNLQKFFSKVYLSLKLRKKLGIKLDRKSIIFHTISQKFDDLHITVDAIAGLTITNRRFNTRPMVFYSDRANTTLLDTIGNYLSHSWDAQQGCVSCLEDTVHLSSWLPYVWSGYMNYPHVYVGVFVEKSCPFVDEFFEQLAALDYPKSLMSVYVHSNAPAHADQVLIYLERYVDEYRCIYVEEPHNQINGWRARNIAIDKWNMSDAQYFFSIDITARLDNPLTLQLLIEQNREIIAPMLVEKGSLTSNFWGGIDSAGRYTNSFDYNEIVNNNRRGVWNVPFISECYLMKRSLLHQNSTWPQYKRRNRRAFSINMQSAGKFMYVTNMVNFGHLVAREPIDPDTVHPDLQLMHGNLDDWERKYLHPRYHAAMAETYTSQTTACPNVFRFPLVSGRFCRDLIEVAAFHGQWDDIAYEHIDFKPTNENSATATGINLRDLGLITAWQWFFNQYIPPLQNKAFVGYADSLKVDRSFVSRHRAGDRESDSSHHDDSIYTISLALSSPQNDYQGGGYWFSRYNCTISNLPRGWALLYPGKLTHYHRELPVTAGSQYTLVSFINN